MNANSSLTPQEVADILKIAKNTVYELIKRGEINSYRVGRKIRIDLKDLEKYKKSTKNIQDSSQSPITENKSPTNSLLQGLPQSNAFVICGQDILLDILARHLESHPNGLVTLRSHIGSYNGLYALYQGKAQIATAHLWDGDTNQYNTPYVKRMLPGTPAVIIHLAGRLQGFYVIKGNPRKITSWEDLRRKDLTIINREKGSGTRVLLDEHLRILKIPVSTIKGYEQEKTSHLSVASAVARGEGDLGLGNEKAGLQVKGIDFIPLQEERYDLIIKKVDFSKPPFQAIIEIIRSEKFKLELEGLGGYNLAEIGKIVAET